MMNRYQIPTKNLELWFAPVVILGFAVLLALMYGWIGTNKSVGGEQAERPEGKWVAAQAPTPGVGQPAHHFPAPFGTGIGNGPNSQMQLINTPTYPLGIGSGPNSQLMLVNQATVYMGMRLTGIDAGRAEKMGIAAQPVLLVQAVEPESPAAKAGLAAGDAIFSVDRQQTGSLDQLGAVLALKTPGKTVKILYSRDGRKQSTHLTLGPLQGLVPAAATQAPGWLGLDIQNIDAVMKEQFKLPSRKGVIISHVTPKSPAATAGLMTGDVITGFNQNTTKDVKGFQALVEQCRAGTSVSLEVLRAGQKATIAVTMGMQPSPAAPPKVPPAEMAVEGSWIGMDVTELEANDAAGLGFPAGTTGILVSDVEGPPASKVGFQSGDLLLAVNGTPTPDMKQFVRATKLQSGAVVDVLRGNRHLYITVPPPGFTQQGTAINPGPAGNFQQVAMNQPMVGRLGILAGGPDLNAPIVGERMPAYLIVVDFGQTSFAAVNLTNGGNPENCIQQHQITALICSDISSLAAARYAGMGVAVYSGVMGPAGDAIQQYGAGNLTAMR